MTIKDVENYLENFFELGRWSRKDSSMNGLQVGDREKPVTKIAFAVDACMESFQLAREVGAQALFVHHGLYWGHPIPVRGDFYRRMEYLIQENLALFAVHLPLDAHPQVGNNAGMAHHLGLEEIRPFGEYKGEYIGFQGRFPEPVKREALLQKLFGGREHIITTLDFGPQDISRVGMVSGGAPWEVTQAIDQGLDLYITGDASHNIVHTAREAGINVVFGGHYLTETWGPRLMASQMAKDLGLETQFIDVPTGL